MLTKVIVCKAYKMIEKQAFKYQDSKTRDLLIRSTAAVHLESNVKRNFSFLWAKWKTSDLLKLGDFRKTIFFLSQASVWSKAHRSKSSRRYIDREEGYICSHFWQTVTDSLNDWFMGISLKRKKRKEERNDSLFLFWLILSATMMIWAAPCVKEKLIY